MEQLYILLDSKSMPLARAVLLSPVEALNWQIQVLDSKMEQVLEHGVVQLVGMSDDVPALLGRITHHRGDRISVEKLRALGEEIRQNLRVPVHFQSFIYPLDGKWKGRRAVEGNDLSCGGISFFCSERLEEKERLEVVIPITEEPVILACEILRIRPGGRTLYAAKFTDICHDEEKLVREAVFSVQLQRHSA